MAATGLQLEAPKAVPATVSLPAPTAWPIVLAFGITLLFAGLLTSAAVSVLGAVFFVTASVGWFRDVLPQEKEEVVEVQPEVITISTLHREVERLAIAPQLSRPLLPLETYPVTAGIKGGIAGSVAMAILACLYGLIGHGSIWYPINLLGATGYAESLQFGRLSLNTFHWNSFLVALLIHGIASLLVGLLYGAALPMVPRHPIFLGGVIAPILWTGILHSVLGLINPLLDARIDWPWFVVSQCGFGIVAGLVVVRLSLHPIRQHMPFALRAGIEAHGLQGRNPPKDGSR